MDDARLGRGIRAIRVQARMRQVDVARCAGLSQPAISDVERGRGDRLSLRALRAVASVLGADVSVELRWRGGEVDRLLDQGHAELVARVVVVLERAGWSTATEVTYSRYGERGSCDILALHGRTGTVLAVEVKTRLVSLEATLRKLDEKTRLAPGMAVDRFGARPRAAARMLVLPEGGVARRAVSRHDAILRPSFPLRAVAARAWLTDPVAPAGILLFVRPSRESSSAGFRAPHITPGTPARRCAGTRREGDARGWPARSPRTPLG